MGPVVLLVVELGWVFREPALDVAGFTAADVGADEGVGESFGGAGGADGGAGDGAGMATATIGKTVGGRPSRDGVCETGCRTTSSNLAARSRTLEFALALSSFKARDWAGSSKSFFLNRRASSPLVVWSQSDGSSASATSDT